jgi:hypothetical protein
VTLGIYNVLAQKTEWAKLADPSNYIIERKHELSIPSLQQQKFTLIQLCCFLLSMQWPGSAAARSLRA